MINKKTGLIICGFPGVGKSTAAKTNINAVDCDSTHFHYKTDWAQIAKNEPTDNEHSKKQKENPNWVSEYVDHIELMSSQFGYQYVFVSSHIEVRTEMDVRGLQYICVVPDKNLKDEYLIRYIKRGNEFDFINKLSFNWGDWLDEIERCGMLVIHLKSGQFLSDIFMAQEQ